MSRTDAQRQWGREWHAKNKARRNLERRQRYHSDASVRRKLIDASGEYTKRNAGRLRAKRYGLTQDDLERELDKGCRICSAFSGYGLEAPPKALHVDHDHSTGAFRGVLCRSCNLLLGAAFENPATLIAAAEYLMKHARATEPIS